jgi:isopenicillin N synthase-like dioxygenase
MTDALPVIDISAPDAAPALGRALETIGFAYVAGHGVPQSVIDGAFAASRAFHASTLAQKQSLAINAWHRGYMGMATSTVVTSSVAKVTRPNLSESLMIMHEAVPEDVGQPLQGPNQWPDWLPGFRTAIETYRQAAERVSRMVIRLIATALGLPEAALDRHFDRPTSFLRLLHYPPHPVDAVDDQFGAAPHTDYGIITLLAQDNSGGLQVRRRDAAGGDGSWIDAAPLPGTFVLNVADMLARWTNDRFVSTPHRVVNRSGGDRYSLPFFFDTAMDSVIECLPTCTGPGNPPRYEKVRYGDYLMDRLNRNYDYRKSEAAE